MGEEIQWEMISFERTRKDHILTYYIAWKRQSSCWGETIKYRGVIVWRNLNQRMRN